MTRNIAELNDHKIAQEWRARHCSRLGEPDSICHKFRSQIHRHADGNKTAAGVEVQGLPAGG
jgi:hypothetical protein